MEEGRVDEGNERGRNVGMDGAREKGRGKRAEEGGSNGARERIKERAWEEGS